MQRATRAMAAMRWCAIALMVVAAAAAVRASCAQPPTGGMLTPQANELRESVSLDGLWTFKCDFENDGMAKRWYEGDLPSPTLLMPVPSSYNDITNDDRIREHIGWVWYETHFRVPSSWSDRRIVLRFNSVHYYTDVWLDGAAVMSHTGGHLPFEANITSSVKQSLAADPSHRFRLTVAVNNTLTPFTLPPGQIFIANSHNTSYPLGYTSQHTEFDFFNYAGIHRQVQLYATAREQYLDDVTVVTDVAWGGDKSASVHVDLAFLSELAAPSFQAVEVRVVDADGSTVANKPLQVNATGHANTTVVFAAGKYSLWRPLHSYLYTLEMVVPGLDAYRLTFGIRTVAWTSSQFLINNEPFYFYGVDKHEDAAVRGKGYDNVMFAKDLHMLQWLNVNAFRTSHYPYAEEMYYMADRLGIVIIGESPAVGMGEPMFFNERTLDHHCDVMQEMIRRDKNHPSVVMWNLANEPLSSLAVAQPYFATLADFTRSILPAGRPITIVESMDYDELNAALFVDIICINRYYAWYTDPGALQLVSLQLSEDLNGWIDKYDKPVMVTEYGADTVEGLHGLPSVMFTEEFQVRFLKAYHDVFDSFREQGRLIGELIWNYQDFRTEQSDTRVGGLNRKGVLTRDREPKMAAHTLRQRYRRLSGLENEEQCGTRTRRELARPADIV